MVRKPWRDVIVLVLEVICTALDVPKWHHQWHTDTHYSFYGFASRDGRCGRSSSSKHVPYNGVSGMAIVLPFLYELEWVYNNKADIGHFCVIVVRMLRLVPLSSVVSKAHLFLLASSMCRLPCYSARLFQTIMNIFLMRLPLPRMHCSWTQLCPAAKTLGCGVAWWAWNKAYSRPWMPGCVCNHLESSCLVQNDCKCTVHGFKLCGFIPWKVKPTHKVHTDKLLSCLVLPAVRVSLKCMWASAPSLPEPYRVS